MLGVAQLRRHKHWLIFALTAAFLIVWYYLSPGREAQPTWDRRPDGIAPSKDKAEGYSTTSSSTISSSGIAPTRSTSHLARPSNTAYTQTVVVAKLEKEDTSWVDDLVDELPDLTSAIYTVDNRTAPLTVPTNKGREAMVYLTYIIDHYSELSDVTLFMHAHKITWHNNDFLDSDLSKMIKRLKNEHVVQNGYMNLRCHQEPGCPDHIHPATAHSTDDLRNIPEAAIIGASWAQLFPNESVPEVVSQPCCGQFAVSSDRIRAVSLDEYVSYRDWILETELEDSISGRVWEYLWQWLFAGQAEFCPDEVFCYCEGYGVCVDPDDYGEYYRLRDQARIREAEADRLSESANDAGAVSEDNISAMRAEAKEMMQKMEAIKAKAVG